MPVGTYGTVKAMTPEELVALGAEIILGNTFHLMLRPGDDIVRALGGLHRFMNWQRPILTDSGGFQVLSLATRNKVRRSRRGVPRAHNGSLIFLTPERAMEVQRNWAPISRWSSMSARHIRRPTARRALHGAVPALGAA